MSELFLLSERHIVRISPHLPRAHGNPRVDDQRVISGIIYVIRNGLRWKDAPKEYGPHKTLYNRFVRWSRRFANQSVFRQIGCSSAPLPTSWSPQQHLRDPSTFRDAPTMTGGPGHQRHSTGYTHASVTAPTNAATYPLR
jgi:hypothetical protein